MSRKKICFVAQFPPPMHGLAKAVETLYNSKLGKEYEFQKVNITDNKKIICNLWRLFVSKADLYYFTMSQTKGGNFRDLIILKLLEIQHKKCVVHLHGGYYRKLVDEDFGEWQRRQNYKRVGKLAGAIVLGASLKYIFEGMIPEEKIFIVPNCIDDEFLMSDTKLRDKVENYAAKTPKHILYLSNFIKEKGYPEVLKLAEHEKQSCEMGQGRRFHFDFAGKFFNTKDEEEFYQYIADKGLQEYVTYHGVVGGNEKRRLLEDGDIFVLLTRYPNEGQPISILEAMGNGMAIVTTNHAGIPDIVRDGVNGVVVDKDTINTEEIYNKAVEIKQSCMLVNRNEAEECYSQDKYIQGMDAVWKEVLE